MTSLLRLIHRNCFCEQPRLGVRVNDSVFIPISLLPKSNTEFHSDHVNRGSGLNKHSPVELDNSLLRRHTPTGNSIYYLKNTHKLVINFELCGQLLKPSYRRRLVVK